MLAAKTADGPSLAIVGVTGAVGQEFLRVRLQPTDTLVYSYGKGHSARSFFAEVL